MPQSPTPKLGLYRPLADGSEFYSVVTDLLNNWDKIDAAMGATAVTSSTRPASAYNGQLIRETDTSRVYVSNGTLPGSASFTTQLVAHAVPILSASATRALRVRAGTSDTDDRWFIDQNGTTWWGSGSAAVDTNIYRSAANVLKTDDSLTVNGNLTVLGVGQKTFILKPSDQTKTSDTTLAADSAITFAMAAAATYLIRVVVAATGTVGDLKTDWSVPASAAGLKFVIGPALSSTDRTDTTMRSSAHGFTTVPTYGLNSTSGARVVEEGHVTTVGAGTWSWRWAQNTSSASATTIEAGSFAIIERVA
jgi:hypothetical protein